MHHPKAKKSLGQNFLQDKNIARKIVDALQISPEDKVLEIGPGPGMLTGFILEAAPASLTLVEKDNYWAGVRREESASGSVPVTVITGDALKQNWASYNSPVKIIGNLPYNVASPLMWDIVSQAGGLQRAVFMVQKEVAQRVAALPSTSAYGALSVWMQCFCVPVMEFVVPPQVFHPRPKVWSAVISLVPRRPDEQPQRPDALSIILKMFFQKRRKQLGTIMRSAGYDPELLLKCDINPASRPENLAPETYKRLSEFF